MFSHHRPISDYLNSLISAGLRLERVEEVSAAVIAKESAEIPAYLIVRAVKPLPPTPSN
jgi:hypothetical protein